MKKIQTKSLMCKDEITLSPAAITKSMNDIISALNLLNETYANHYSVKVTRLAGDVCNLYKKVHNMSCEE